MILDLLGELQADMATFKSNVKKQSKTNYLPSTRYSSRFDDPVTMEIHSLLDTYFNGAIPNSEEKLQHVIDYVKQRITDNVPNDIIADSIISYINGKNA